MICVDGECKTPECKDDEDCPPGFVCVNGECVSAPCKGDEDCPPGMICVDGECKKSFLVKMMQIVLQGLFVWMVNASLFLVNLR